MKVEVAVPGSPSLTVTNTMCTAHYTCPSPQLTVSVDVTSVKQQ